MIPSLVGLSVQQNFSRYGELPGFLSAAYLCVHALHRAWFWYRRIEIYSNTDNFLKLVGGHTVNWLAGDRKLVRIAAQAVLIATRIFECVEEYEALHRECHFFWAYVADMNALPKKIEISAIGSNRFISPSTHYFFLKKWHAVAFRVKRFALALFFLGKRLFRLSMCTIDAMRAFSCSDDTRHESMNELFVNSSKCLKALCANREVLISCIEDQRSVIRVVLQKSRSVITVEQLIGGVQRGFNAAERVHTGIEAVSERIGRVSRDLLKRAAFGVFQAAGLVKYMPDEWVPSLEPPWIDDGNAIEDARFPPLDHLRIG